MPLAGEAAYFGVLNTGIGSGGTVAGAIGLGGVVAARYVAVASFFPTTGSLNVSSYTVICSGPSPAGFR